MPHHGHGHGRGREITQTCTLTHQACDANMVTGKGLFHIVLFEQPGERMPAVAMETSSRARVDRIDDTLEVRAAG